MSAGQGASPPSLSSRCSSGARVAPEAEALTGTFQHRVVPLSDAAEHSEASETQTPEAAPAPSPSQGRVCEAFSGRRPGLRYYISSTTLLCVTFYTAETATFPFKHCRRRERPAACPLCLCLGGKSMEADSGFPFHRMEGVFGCSCNLSPVGLGLDSHRAHRLTLLLFLPLSILSFHLFSFNKTSVSYIVYMGAKGLIIKQSLLSQKWLS